MFKSKILFILSCIAIALIGFTSCNDDDLCDGNNCGPNGVPFENIALGTCDCLCDTGFIESNGTCVEEPCFDVNCGENGTAVEDVVFGTCLCECDAGYVLSNGTCVEDACADVDCGPNGVPIEDVIFGACDCNCDAGYLFIEGTCVNISESCPEVECGLGEVVLSASGDCFCDCPVDTINNGDGLGCVAVGNCDDTNCVNGDCVNNVCECLDFYEGEDCDALSLTKFIGTWTTTETCLAEVAIAGQCDNFQNIYTFTISQNGQSIMTVILNSFFDVDGYGNPFFPSLVAEIDGNNLIVPLQSSTSQFYNYITSGTGVYSVSEDGLETVTFDFTVRELDENGVTTCEVNCSSVWTKN